jgi:GH15 family glucan-1,4-alpha-glucosidase
MAMIANWLGRTEDSLHWHKTAESIRTELLARATTPGGWLSGALDADVADASILLLPQLGIVSATDERVKLTLKIVEERLLRNGLVLRYNEADDFGLPETAFLACTYWYVDALAAAGRKAQGREIFSRLLEHRSSAGLLSEDVHPQTGELWGNYPQTYSHVGLILSAHRLSRSWEEGPCPAS